MGTSFKWHPTSFEDVVRSVTSATGVLLSTMVTMLRQMGSLNCPAPEWDSRGVYRVGLVGGKPTIQKLQSAGNWTTATLHPPSTPSANTRLKDQKFGILDAPSLLDSDLQSASGSLGVALIYLDVDGFKQVNTKFTETVVDQEILPVLQKHLVEWTGSLGHVYAEGGDEIVILLPNFTSTMAAAFAEEIRQRVAALKLPVGKEQVNLTISLGVAATSNAKENTNLRRLANESKQHAKLTGKNKVVTHGENGPLTLMTALPSTIVTPVSLENCLLGEFDYPVVYRSKKLLRCRIRIRTVQQLNNFQIQFACMLGAP
jgi:diguanylate cyclase (GGDEF)-like protein